MGDFPHIRHQVAVVVIGNPHRQLGIRHDDGGIALEDRGMAVIGAPVLEPVVVDGVLHAVPGNDLMVETQVAGKTAGGRQDDRALAVDRGLGARRGPNAHFIDPAFEAGADGCRYRPRTIGCTCVQGDCRGLFSAVDIQAQAFVDRIEHGGEMGPDLQRYEVIDRGDLQQCRFVDVGETHERQPRIGNTEGVVLRPDVAADDDILAVKGGLRVHPRFNCPAAIEGEPAGLRQGHEVAGTVEFEHAVDGRVRRRGAVRAGQPFVVVLIAVAVCIVAQRMSTEFHFLNIGQAIVVLVFVAVIDTIVIRVGTVRVVAGEELVEVVDAVIVRVTLDVAVDTDDDRVVRQFTTTRQVACFVDNLDGARSIDCGNLGIAQAVELVCPDAAELVVRRYFIDRIRHEKQPGLGSTPQANRGVHFVLDTDPGFIIDTRESAGRAELSEGDVGRRALCIVETHNHADRKRIDGGLRQRQRIVRAGETPRHAVPSEEQAG